jgi:ABC-type glycerol-3-phosphate transport system substrate-binding protein
MDRRKYLYLLGGAAAVAAAGYGVYTLSQPGEEPPPDNGNGDVKQYADVINISGSGPYFTSVVEKYPTFTENTGIEVEQVELPAGDRLAKVRLEAQAMSGALNCTLHFRGAQSVPLYNEGAMLDLKPYVKPEVFDDHWPFDLAYNTWGEVTPWLSHAHDIHTLFYRTDLFAEQGWTADELEESWDSIIEWGKLAKAAYPDRYALCIAGAWNNTSYMFSQFMWQAGGDWTDDDGVPRFNDEFGVMAVNQQKRMFDEGLTSPAITSWTWGDTRSNFAADNVVCTYEFSDTPAVYQDPAISSVIDNWDIAYMPAPEPNFQPGGSVSWDAGWLMGIPKGNTEEVCNSVGLLIEFILAPEQMAYMGTRTGSLPATQSGMDKLLTEGGPGPIRDLTSKAHWEFYEQMFDEEWVKVFSRDFAGYWLMTDDLLGHGIIDCIMAGKDVQTMLDDVQRVVAKQMGF